MSAPSVRLGIDIGGTFTDAVLVDESGSVVPFKLPTTPRDPSEGFMAIVDEAVRERCEAPTAVHSLAHATTVATNAIIEGTGARVALVVTRGFRDILEIARQIRPDLFDLLRHKPTSLVPRDLVFEVVERVGPRGEVITPLSEASVDAVCPRLADREVDAVVVCLLHSYVDSRHERLVAARLRERLPGVDVTMSSEVWPEFREYFRASTAIINAMLRPIVGTYLQDVRQGLQQRGIDRPLWVMQSNGGVLAEHRAVEVPVQLIESGPAAGLTYAAHLAKTLEHDNLVSFEVGGTTAKVGVVVAGTPAMTTEFEVGAMAAAGSGRGKGSGYPIRTPVLDLVEIGAGGGSLAWVDSGGVLRVGPKSAGADPGPACYGRGGDRPTLTDANLVLGRIDPGRFLGGAMTLSRDAAVAAIDRHCATPLGLDVETVASGIVEVATASMARALRLVTVERGHDPREFAMLAFGGAGPLHAALLAQELGFREVVVPQHPGVLSAAGLLAAPVRVLETQTSLALLDELDGDEVRAVFAPLRDRAVRSLVAQGVDPARVEHGAALDLRYRGQSYELTIGLNGTLGENALSDVAKRFHEEHERAYGHAAPDEPIEVVNWRLSAWERSDSALRAALLPKRSGAGPAPLQLRGGAAPVYARASLLAKDRLRGPAVITEAHATTYVPEGFAAGVDKHGNLRIQSASK